MKKLLMSVKRGLEAQFRNLCSLLERNRRIRKLVTILTVIVLMLSIRFFFYAFLSQNVYAEAGQDEINFETIDPWDKLGNGVISQKCQTANYDFCFNSEIPSKSKMVRNPKILEQKIMALVEGYPIEQMVPYIAQQDEKVAFFIVAIAKKESDWGKHVPVLNGQDCYNYWGFRASRSRMGTGGHTCFDSPEDAVSSVAKRIDSLVYEKKLDTPAKMVVWKCGSSCRTHDPGSVTKWISDVDLYLKKLNS